jgi:hypothetical protein
MTERISIKNLSFIFAISCLILTCPLYSQAEGVPSTQTKDNSKVEIWEKTKEVSKVIESFGMLIIAFIVAVVAILQLKINRDRLRLELYRKRFSIYEGLQAFLDKIMIRLVATDEDLREFRASTDEAVFLFKKDIIKYLKEIHDKGTKLYSYNCKHMDPNLPIPTKQEEEENTVICNWLQRQLEDSKKKFSRYLKFGTKT